MALNVVQYEDIMSLLGEVPPLVDALQARDVGFPDDVLAWLKRVETALESNRVPAVSQISSCRGLLIEAGRGVRLEDVEGLGRCGFCFWRIAFELRSHTVPLVKG